MVGEVMADRYELEELVGSGGMSSVFRARDRLLDRHVALKVLHQHYAEDGEYVERFRREARAVAQLSHPNIVTVIDRGESDGQQFIVFEYIDGQNLKQVLEESGLPPVRDAPSFALGVARGSRSRTTRAHPPRRKPQNVLLNGDGVKGHRFLIARSLTSSTASRRRARATPNYIAPEQPRRPRRRADRRTARVLSSSY
jgi:serine/threonine-protein kinase